MRSHIVFSLGTAIFLSLGFAAVAQERPIDRWEKTTAVAKDPSGKTIKKVVEYPVFHGSKAPKMSKAVEFKNCWDWCRQVCDGYGVCWIACGTKCQGW